MLCPTSSRILYRKMANHTENAKRRRSIRLPDYDYTTLGAYFVTVCVYDHRRLFGDVVDGQMQLNELGDIVMKCWQEIPEHFSNVELDAFVVMPNHVHGILVFHENSSKECSVPKVGAFGKMVSGSLSTIIRSFKSAVTRENNKIFRTPGIPTWQRSYYEHVIRRTDKMNRIREYIRNNPLRWEFDQENPEHEQPSGRF